jgi:hypothetical protein
MSLNPDFLKTLEFLSARRQYLIEHRRLSETWEKELDALTMAIKSMQKWLQEYNTSPCGIDEFVANHQFHLRMENRFIGTPY